MAKAGVGYPQVEARVTALMDRRVVGRSRPTGAWPMRFSAAERARGGCGGPGSASRGEAARPRARGAVGARRTAGACRGAGMGLPERAGGGSEIVARRLAHRRRAVDSRAERPGTIVGVIDSRARWRLPDPRCPSRTRLDRLESTGRRRRGSGCCASPARSAEGLGTPVFAVGGFVRDLLLGQGRARRGPGRRGRWRGLRAPAPRGDRGDAWPFTRAFGTASIEGATGALRAQPSAGSTSPPPVASATTRRGRSRS